MRITACWIHQLQSPAPTTSPARDGIPPLGFEVLGMQGAATAPLESGIRVTVDLFTPVLPSMLTSHHLIQIKSSINSLHTD